MDSGGKPKRVAGGLVLKTRKKKRRSGAAASSLAAAGDGGSPSPSGVPSILTAAPAEDDPTSATPPPPTSSEFDDSNDEALCVDAPSDALLCLRSYTRPAAGDTMAETCMYCPIFTHEPATSDGGGGGGSSDRSTHAAPFLPKHVLLHLLSSSSSSGRMGIEQEVKQLAMSNEIRLLQLHGTAACAGGAGGAGFGGDGNDDDDVAVVEASVYEEAARMALQNFAALGSQPHKVSVDEVHSWLTVAFLPYFAGKTWISEWALNSFLHAESNSQEQRVVAKQYAKQYSMAQKKEMIQQLVHAGILLPRRGVGPGGGGEGHWLSLPGIGRAARSIVDGRTNLLRRLRSSKYKEKRRSTLEHEIGRIKRHANGGTTGKSKLEQSGKIVVLDLLAKGWVRIHTTCEGEQYVRLAE